MRQKVAAQFTGRQTRHGLLNLVFKTIYLIRKSTIFKHPILLVQQCPGKVQKQPGNIIFPWLPKILMLLQVAII